jgi:hypothetical protein
LLSNKEICEREKINYQFFPSPLSSSRFPFPFSFLPLSEDFPLVGPLDLDREDDDAEGDLRDDLFSFLSPLDLELLLLRLDRDRELLLLLDLDELLEEERLRSLERDGDLLSLPLIGSRRAC